MCNLAKQYVLELRDINPTKKFVAYRVAEIVNDQHDHDLWINPTNLAREIGIDRSGVSKYLNEMVDAGMMEKIEEGRGSGSVSRYRFTACNHLHQEVCTHAHIDGEVCTHAHISVHPCTHAPITNLSKNIKDLDLLSETAEAVPDPDPIDVDLCQHLADRYEQTHGTKLKQSTAWLNDMRLLRERGPTCWDKPAPLDPDKIRRLANWALDDEFWSGNIRSPGALRKHWEKLRTSANSQRTSKATTNGYQLSDKRRDMADKISEYAAEGKSLGDLLRDTDPHRPTRPDVLELTP